jgi:hypothetical protein
MAGPECLADALERENRRRLLTHDVVILELACYPLLTAR